MKRETARRRVGFTLVELLVVIGIIAVLAAIVVPMVNSARRSADRTRTKMDLNGIALALEAYKQDFKDYPRPPRDKPSNLVLAWALIGPFQADSSSPSLGAAVTNYDGADGGGFRTQWDPATKTGSKVWGPYLNIEKFPLSDDRLTIKDRFGGNIDYFPKWRNPKKVPSRKSNPGTVFVLFDTVNTAPNAVGIGIYDWHQADQMAMSGATPKAVIYFSRALGDLKLDDEIAGAEQLSDCPDFLLLSRGSNGNFDFIDEADMIKKLTVKPGNETIDRGNFEKLSEVSNLP